MGVLRATYSALAPFCRWILALSLFFSASLYADIPYDIRFQGVPNSDIVKTMESMSTLVSLRDRYPSTITALRRRAEADLPTLVDVMHSFSYYEAEITYSIQQCGERALVMIHVKAGPPYMLADFYALPYSEDRGPCGCREDILDKIDHADLDICLGRPAISDQIIAATQELILLLTEQGYALAYVVKQDIVADQCTKTLRVTLYVDTGPRMYFGETTIVGLCSVSEDFVRMKITWEYGGVFSPCEIERTERLLLSTELFSFVRITYGEDDETPDNLLPMVVEVKEAKPRSIGAGFGYTTQLGPGIAAEWEHRNLRHRGERLSFKTELWSKKQKGVLAYRLPNFYHRDQDFIWMAEHENEDITAYEEAATSISGIVERRICDNKGRFTYGGTIKRLRSSKSDDLHHDFTLIKAPISYSYSTADDLLNPTSGRAIALFTSPTTLIGDGVNYVTNLVTLIGYHSVNCDDNLIFASKLTAGSIIGAGRRSIPAPERFYAGSETTLRGYKYLTVSPLNANGDPIGGRSLLVLSLEARIRSSEKIGWVVFYEVGNVYLEQFPDLRRKMLQSVGLGFRYFTPVGPIRLDVAFPLNRRRHLDPAFQFYFSIGQAF